MTPTSSPESQVEARELEEKVAACLAPLRPEFRTLIVLRDIQGLSYQEIGDVLGCSEKAVKSRLFRRPRPAPGRVLTEHLPRADVVHGAGADAATREHPQWRK